jgi:MFS transporter, PAT family, beta-lactamase induction signal transducer AmpG
LTAPAFTKPVYIFFLVIPSGISIGFVSVTLPYILTHHGFSVAEAATIVAAGVSANLWRFLWGPIADLSLSLKKWYWLGVMATTITLLLLCFIPLTQKGAMLLTLLVFLSQVASTLLLLPVGSFMAHRIEDKKKGQAAGWFQAGNLGGVGVGGGAGLWLATHYNLAVAGAVLGFFLLLFALVVVKIQDVRPDKGKTIKAELAYLGKDILSMIRIPIVLFAIILICLPIGTGSLGNVWSSIADDWKTSSDTVALITGVLGGLVSALGCILGGMLADHWGVWKAYLGFGLVYAVAIIAMTTFPMLPYVYIAGVLSYSFFAGLCYAAFSAILLFAIGRKNAATKYSMLSSLGNLPVVYMTTFDGWAHDKYGSRPMMVAESVITIVCILACVLVLQGMKAKKLLLKTID